MDKSALRARPRVPAPPGSSEAIARFLCEMDFPEASVVAGVWPLPGEIDLRPALQLLAARGHVIVLPQTPPRGAPLIFRRWTPETRMLPERFGTFYPDGEVLTPTIVLVPMLAFTRAGDRLGYGGGYYDRTLAGLPHVRVIGTAHTGQEVAHIPVEPHDIRLGCIVTEAEVIGCAGVHF